MRNILLAISGPSGVGKGTLVKLLLERDENLTLSISCTTRQPRTGETHGKEYFFLSKEEFAKKIAEQGFLEYDEHFNNFYGTPKSFVEEQLKTQSVVLEIDVRGVMQVKERMPDAVSIFIAPPSSEALMERLKGRGTESDEEVSRRIERAEFELSYAKDYDYTVVNDDLERAYQEIQAVITAERNK